MNVGTKIRNIRKQKGMTLKQVADIMGCSPQHISQYENGKRIPKIETLMRLSQALKVDIDDLADTSEQAAIDIREHPEKWGLDKESFSKERIDFAFKKLNTTGKEKAAERVEELTEIPRYTNPDEPQEQ